MATKKDEVKIGQVWTAKVNGRVVKVRVDRIDDVDGLRPFGRPWANRPATTRYYVTNLETGRETVFRSATKLRQLLSDAPILR